ncbi:hypothetical protein T260_07210 [Geobacillus thermopakistaniensis]|uniref:Uncharacterized protein n=1 Tax=Geobacillus thermopakistaniensis (strain MAS1) TaxID=1408282 RepID=A0A7U9P7F4_GEOTM|nr:hypothetical protein T260_07210 [Geobacillus sp. MAS1]
MIRITTKKRKRERPTGREQRSIGRFSNSSDFLGMFFGFGSAAFFIGYDPAAS